MDALRGRVRRGGTVFVSLTTALVYKLYLFLYKNNFGHLEQNTLDLHGEKTILHTSKQETESRKTK